MIREYDENGLLKKVVYTRYKGLDEEDVSFSMFQEHDEHGRVTAFYDDKGDYVEKCDYDNGHLYTYKLVERHVSMGHTHFFTEQNDYYFEGTELVNCISSKKNNDSQVETTREYWYEYDEKGRINLITSDFGYTEMFGYDDTPVIFDGQYIPNATKRFIITENPINKDEVKKTYTGQLCFPDNSSITYYRKEVCGEEINRASYATVFEKDDDTIYFEDVISGEKISLKFNKNGQCITPNPSIMLEYKEDGSIVERYSDAYYHMNRSKLTTHDENGRVYKIYEERNGMMGPASIVITLKYYDDDLCSYSEIEREGTKIEEGFSTLITGNLLTIGYEHRINFEHEISKASNE